MSEKKKVLIVDDEEQSRLYLATLIGELRPELTIYLAASPSEALFILHKENIDLILLDVELPSMTGLEMLQQLREKQPGLPVIFISGYKKVEFIRQALRLDAIDYIDKPADPIELETAFQKVFLQKTNSIRENQKGNRFCLLTASGEMFVEASSIIYFCSDKRYSIVHLTDGSIKSVHDNLANLMRKLPAKYFLRVSRQHIVNVNTIRFASKSNKTITLQSPTPIILDKIYPTVIKQLIDKFSL